VIFRVKINHCLVEFTFNQNKPKPFTFLRIDRYLYKFNSTTGGVYKLDFKSCDFNSTIIPYPKYLTYQLKLTGRFNRLKGHDEPVLLTCLHIVQDFLQKRITGKAMLVKQDELLSDDIFELKRRFDSKKLGVLLEEEESIIYLVKEVEEKKQA